jgi:hypothetical protein
MVRMVDWGWGETLEEIVALMDGSPNDPIENH